MHFKAEQHRLMAGLLHQREIKSSNPRKAKKQSRMANLMRLLARKAKKSK